MNMPLSQPRRPRARLLALGVLLTMSPLAVLAQMAEPPASSPAFRDTFDSLDLARWYVSDGWSNGEWQACTWSSRMVAIEDGTLQLTLAPSGPNASATLCGELQSNDRYGYGTFEARLRTDEASGVIAAFFTYIGPTHGEPHDEVDVEILTRDTGQVEFNTYRDGTPAGGTAVPLPAASDEGYLTYSFIWEPERIRWYVDGVLAHEATGPDLPRPPQKIYFSHWNTQTLTDWMGPFTDPGRPLVMSVDWMAYTPLGTACPFEGSVLCVPGVL